jgi:membrane associated rhomboid family serine protease
MYLPIRTEGDDGRIRPGVCGILLLCLLMHLAVWHDKSKHAAAVSILKYGSSSCPTGRMQIKAMETAEDFGILKAAGMTIARDPVITDRLEHMRKASLIYKSALVADDLNPVNFLTALFTHAGWLHLALTVWFLYAVAGALEKHWGTGLFLGMFLGCGILGEFAYLIVNGHSEKSAGFALVGPCGAMAGLMGAFAATHWNAGVEMLDFRFGHSGRYFRMSARHLLALWAGAEILSQLFLPGRGGGLAFSACIAGGLAGAALGGIIPGAVRPSLPKHVHPEGLGF